MRGFFSKRSEAQGLEAELRASRPEPRAEFLSTLAGNLQPRRERTHSSFRLAFAGALTVGLIAAFGGLSLASPTTPPGNSGATKPGWGCGDQNHVHTGPPGNQYATSPCK
jgi:hypothetical protein